MLIVGGVGVVLVVLLLLLLSVMVVVVEGDGSDARGGRRGWSTESTAAYLSS